MSTPRQFMQALQAMVELQTDERPQRSQPEPASASLGHTFADIGSLPREALFLGMAQDGLPVLLNLHDPLPGSLLVTGDAGTGKTRFLQGVVRGVLHTHRPDEVQYAVVTSRPAEWDAIEKTGHQVGVFSAQHGSAEDVFLSMASWAHANRSKQSVLLLIDDLEAVAAMSSDALTNLRWLLLRGPARRVWTVVTQTAGRYGQVLGWIPMFRTRIFGQISQGPVARAVGGGEALVLDQLEAGRQFALRESGHWLRFWVP